MNNLDNGKSRPTSFLRKMVSKLNCFARSIRAHTALRLVAMPLQKVIDRCGNTHRFLTKEGIRTLHTDRWENAWVFFRQHTETLVKGNLWADAFWKNAFHHFDPKTKQGLWIWPAAPDQCKNWFDQAIRHWKKGDLRKSLFLLGACIHIVQDACQPYHSNCRVVMGHQKYERWADKHKKSLTQVKGGVYGLSSHPEGWVISNAEFSHGFLHNVLPRSKPESKEQATTALLSRAAQTTAGFLLFFLETLADSQDGAMGPRQLLFLKHLLSIAPAYEANSSLVSP